MNRRQWIKTGVLGAALLGTASWFALRAPRGTADPVASVPAAPAWHPQAGALFEALAPVIVGPACATPALRKQTAEGVRLAVSNLSPAAQAEVGELIALLNLAPARMLLAGVWQSWPEASADDIAAFLQRWRSSRLSLLQSGYHALHDLVLGAWYASESSWAAIGYPGPPPITPGAAVTS